jgi:hypothetical protein
MALFRLYVYDWENHEKDQDGTDVFKTRVQSVNCTQKYEMRGSHCRVDVDCGIQECHAA